MVSISGSFFCGRSTDSYSLTWQSHPSSSPGHVRFQSPSGKLPVVDNEGRLPTAADSRPIGNMVEHHVTLNTAHVVTQNLSLAIEDTVINAFVDTGADVSYKRRFQNVYSYFMAKTFDETVHTSVICFW